MCGIAAPNAGIISPSKGFIVGNKNPKNTQVMVVGPHIRHYPLGSTSAQTTNGLTLSEKWCWDGGNSVFKLECVQ